MTNRFWVGIRPVGYGIEFESALGMDCWSAVWPELMRLLNAADLQRYTCSTMQHGSVLDQNRIRIWSERNYLVVKTVVMLTKICHSFHYKVVTFTVHFLQWCTLIDIAQYLILALSLGVLHSKGLCKLYIRKQITFATGINKCKVYNNISTFKSKFVNNTQVVYRHELDVNSTPLSSKV